MLQCKNSFTEPSSPPLSLEVAVWSAKSITITWMKPRLEDLNGELTGYIIRVNSTVTSNTSRARVKRETIYVSELHNISTNKTKYSIENLRPATEYSLEVAAVTSIGHGPFSKPIYQSTGEDGKCSAIYLPIVTLFLLKLTIFKWS